LKSVILLAAIGRGCVKTQKKSAHEKFGFLEPSLCDFLGVGDGHPTRENFMFLRFYTAWAKSGRSIAPLNKS
jgi:hypothetical protein